MEWLPDPLLGRIFAAAGREAGVSDLGAGSGPPPPPPVAARCAPTSTFCGPATQATITLVSRRWNQMFYSEPALWQSLELTAASLKWADAESHARQWFAAKASLLRRVGGFVQHLRYSQVLDVEEEEEEEEDEEEKEDSGMLDMQQLAADCGIEWQQRAGTPEPHHPAVVAPAVSILECRGSSSAGALQQANETDTQLLG